MDFLDFDDHTLYFDEPLTPEQTSMLAQAAKAYPDSELLLNELFQLRPDSLTVLVACYRYYYYQHRYEEALDVAEHAKSLGLKVDWQELDERYLGQGVFVSMGLIRFYMLALKGSAYLLMRLGRIDDALKRLRKIIELDPADQFGAAFLYQMAEREQANLQAESYSNIESLFRR